MPELEEYYTATQAAEVLSKNSGKKINPAYVRMLAKYGKLEPKQVGTRLNLYPKSQVDSYIVEERGEKSGRAKRQRALEKKVSKETDLSE